MCTSVTAYPGNTVGVRSLLPVFTMMSRHPRISLPHSHQPHHFPRLCPRQHKYLTSYCTVHLSQKWQCPLLCHGGTSSTWGPDKSMVVVRDHTKAFKIDINSSCTEAHIDRLKQLIKNPEHLSASGDKIVVRGGLYKYCGGSSQHVWTVGAVPWSCAPVRKCTTESATSDWRSIRHIARTFISDTRPRLIEERRYATVAPFATCLVRRWGSHDPRSLFGFSSGHLAAGNWWRPAESASFSNSWPWAWTLGHRVYLPLSRRNYVTSTISCCCRDRPRCIERIDACVQFRRNTEDWGNWERGPPVPPNDGTGSRPQGRDHWSASGSSRPARGSAPNPEVAELRHWTNELSSEWKF